MQRQNTYTHKQLQQETQNSFKLYTKRKQRNAAQNAFAFDNCRMRRGVVFHWKGVLMKKDLTIGLIVEDEIHMRYSDGGRKLKIFGEMEWLLYCMEYHGPG